MQYYILYGAMQEGPYTYDELISKNLNTDTKVRTSNSLQWITIAELTTNDDSDHSFLEGNITLTGTNPFATSNLWWYIIGIVVFGLSSAYITSLIYEDTNLRYYFKSDNLFSGFLYVILPIICLIFSKILQYIFIYKKWKLVGQLNPEAPYNGTIVWHKYIVPLFIFVGIIIVLSVLNYASNSSYSNYTSENDFYRTKSSRSNQVISSLVGICYIIFGIYYWIWEYRLLSKFPTAFNAVSETFTYSKVNNVPTKLGIAIWWLSLISAVCNFAPVIIKKIIDLDMRGNYKTTMYILECIKKIGLYGIDFMYVLWAILIYKVITTSKHIYNNM